MRVQFVRGHQHQLAEGSYLTFREGSFYELEAGLAEQVIAEGAAVDPSAPPPPPAPVVFPPTELVAESPAIKEVAQQQEHDLPPE